MTRIPCSAPKPVPTITAVGVASPRAQGQAMIRTVTAAAKAAVKAGAGKRINQTTKVMTAMTKTRGTKTPLTRSANLWIGAFDPWACSTSLTIWARTVSAPIRVALNWRLPDLLMVAPMTESPFFFSTGRDSPVTIDSSMALSPSTISPSTAIFSPGLTRITSPTTTASMGRVTNSFSRKTVAVLAANPSNFLIASEAWPLARSSRNLPNIIRTIMTAAVSKYICGSKPADSKIPG